MMPIIGCASSVSIFHRMPTSGLFVTAYPATRSDLLQEIYSGQYQFSPQQKIIKLNGEVIHRCAEFGGEFRDIEDGTSRGCPISPLLGALYLSALDNHFAEKDAYYIRYMDDILILSKTRWQNRKVVRELNQILSGLKVEKHPDRTFIGKVERGFDFLGYHFSREPLRLAQVTTEKHVLHIIQLYEQLRIKKATSNEMADSLGLYVKRWQRWATAGLQGIKLDAVYEQNLDQLVPSQIAR
jgi:RNA-directed DNA polymerase